MEDVGVSQTRRRAPPLRGQGLELVLPGAIAAVLSGWRKAFLPVDEASSKCRPADARYEIGRLT